MRNWWFIKSNLTILLHFVSGGSKRNYKTKKHYQQKREVILPLSDKLKSESYINYVWVEILLWFNIGGGKTLGTLLFPVSSTVKSLTCYVDYPGPCE